MPAMVARPEPNRSMEAGSGTGATGISPDDGVVHVKPPAVLEHPAKVRSISYGVPSWYSPLNPVTLLISKVPTSTSRLEIGVEDIQVTVPIREFPAQMFKTPQVMSSPAVVPFRVNV